MKVIVLKDSSREFSKWYHFVNGLDLDFRVFTFMLFLICLFRIGFIAIMRDYIGDTASIQDVWMSFFYGFRLSLKSAGSLAVVAFFLCTVPGTLLRWDLSRVRLYLGYAYAFILCILFFARIPYFEIFQATYNQMIFNTAHEDLYALLETAFKQYQLMPRSIGALAVTGIAAYLLRKLLCLKQTRFPFHYIMNMSSRVSRTAFLVGLIIFAIFIRFGGSLTYAYSIHWENSAVTRDNLLNEAILDDMQAVYRAYSQNRHIQRAMSMNVKPESIREYGNILAGRVLDGNTIDQYVKHTAGGPVIQKPKHIFLVVGESYANWPLWERYKDLNIANGLKEIIQRDDSVYIPAFLPSGTGTITSVNAIITGLAEVNLSPNYQSRSYKGPYETALAPQLKKLGYETHFWYGGFYSWQRLRDFAKAQGFDYFHAANDFAEKEGNSWGALDSILLNAVQSSLSDQAPSFHVILTTSNHPPYTIDTKKEGFDSSKVSGLPPKIKLEGEWLGRLGHFWYADKYIASFVNAMQQKYSDSLFIITGDHADRMNLEPNPDLMTRYSIPLVVHGRGIHKNSLSPRAAGSHLDILPTIMELIAPKGSTYYSLGRSLTSDNPYGFNQELWVSPSAIGKIGQQRIESHEFANPSIALDTKAIEREINAKHALSWWRIKHGNTF